MKIAGGLTDRGVVVGNAYDKYSSTNSCLRRIGNTPGHVLHWSRRELLRFVERYFDIVTVRGPLPWTMLLCRAKR